MYLHIVADQLTNTNLCSNHYSYLPIARCDLTEELMQERWHNIMCFTASNCFMPENAVVWFTRSLWRESLIESNQTPYK